VAICVRIIVNLKMRSNIFFRRDSLHQKKKSSLKLLNIDFQILNEEDNRPSQEK